ncbi:MAG: tRNA-intron lyase [Candidatus Thermoplasmatota archaeon]
MHNNAEIFEGKIIVKNKKSINRLHNNKGYGKKLENGKLKINPVEAFFLLSENKITIYDKRGKKISLNKFYRTYFRKFEGFLKKIISYKDLRERGYNLRIYGDSKKYDFKVTKKKPVKKKCYIKTFYEEEKIKIKKIDKILKDLEFKKEELWLAIVDEEVDVTYYKANRRNLKGNQKESKISKIKDYLSNNRALILNEKKAEKLFKNGFFGKPYIKSLQISSIENLYLQRRNILEKKNRKKEDKLKNKDLEKYYRYLVYSDLKKRGLIVKTGFKYGSHFRAYSKGPDKSHAEYLITVLPENFKFQWLEISRGLRVAQTVNKKMIYSIVKGRDTIKYLELTRFRP